MSRVIVVFAFVCTFLTSRLLAQSSSALINEALDKQVKLDINATLPQAMASIANETGVKIDAAPSVWELLPWGQQTNIKAKIENQTLREALEAITRKLGLTFVLQDEAVELRPMPALKRLGRRANLPELQVLDFLSSNPLGASTDHLTIRQLLATVDSRLEKFQVSAPDGRGKVSFAVENRFFDGPAQDKEIAVPRNATLMEALEAITNATPATWYPWGKTLVIVNKEEPIRTQLGKTITVRFNGVDLSQVLSELRAARSGVAFTLEPGAIGRVPPDARNVRLVLDNASVQQALETIIGATGLSYQVNDKGVYIWNPSAGQTGAPREPMFGLLQLDNGMQVLIPQSQVPADLREYLKTKTSKQFEKIRQQMKEEGFKPAATQPAASQPADERL